MLRKAEPAPEALPPAVLPILDLSQDADEEELPPQGGPFGVAVKGAEAKKKARATKKNALPAEALDQLRKIIKERQPSKKTGLVAQQKSLPVKEQLKLPLNVRRVRVGSGKPVMEYYDRKDEAQRPDGAHGHARAHRRGEMKISSP